MNLNKDFIKLTSYSSFLFYSYKGCLFYLCWFLYALVIIYYYCFNQVLLCDPIPSSSVLDESGVNIGWLGDNNTNVSNQPNLSNNDSNNKCLPLLSFDEYVQKGKSRVFWFLFERDKGNYSNYEDFIKAGSNISIRSAIKTGIKNDFDKLKVHKRTLYWVLGRRNPGNRN